MRGGGIRPELCELGTQLPRRDELADREILHPFLRPGGECFGRGQLAGEDQGAVVAEHQGRLGEGGVVLRDRGELLGGGLDAGADFGGDTDRARLAELAARVVRRARRSPGPAGTATR